MPVLQTEKAVLKTAGSISRSCSADGSKSTACDMIGREDRNEISGIHKKGGYHYGILQVLWKEVRRGPSLLLSGGNRSEGGKGG